MQLIVDQLLDLGKQKTDCKAFVRSLCTMKIIQRMNELDCREAASQTLIFLQRHLEALGGEEDLKNIFDFKILEAGMSLVSHESPQDSLIKKITEYTKAQGSEEKEAIDKE